MTKKINYCTIEIEFEEDVLESVVNGIEKDLKELGYKISKTTLQDSGCWTKIKK